MSRGVVVKAERILPSQAAQILGVSAGYVRWLTDTGRLPVERGPMGIRLIDKAAVENLARDRQKQRGSCERGHEAMQPASDTPPAGARR